MNIKDRMIMDDYSNAKENYVKLGELVHNKLSCAVEAAKIRVMEIEHNVKDEKTIESMLYKDADRYQGLADITSVLTVKVVCYFKDEVESIVKIIDENFNIETANEADRIYVCKVLDAIDDSENDIHFEIQVKTVLEHTWSTINNDLGYSEFGIPYAVKKEFDRLAGLLEIADDEFVRVRDDMKTHTEIARAKIINDNADDVIIDAISLNEYMLRNKKMRKFLEDLAAIEGSEISDINSESYITQLAWFRVKTIGDLQRMLDKNSALALEFAKRVLMGSELDILSSNVALRFLCRAALINGGYDDEQMVEFLMLSVNKKERAEREVKRLYKMYGNMMEGH